MKNEKKLLFLLALSRVDLVGRGTLHRLREELEEFPDQLHAYSLEHISQICCVTKGIAQRIKNQFSFTDAQKEYEDLKKKGVHVLSFDDSDFPENLRHIYDPPVLLYGMGNLSLLNEPSFAVIGSRTPTPYGRRIARDFGESLTRAGFCVVSGIARGIDSEAHRGALQGTGDTIGVLGCGLNHVFPRGNEALYEEIARRGLLLTEYPPEKEPIRRQFPERNRIISGLTKGTVVVESALSSGSHITAKLALEQGREVYAVPGSIHSSRSKGCHELIKKSGAKLVEGLPDILEEFHYLNPVMQVGKSETDSMKGQLTLEEAEILAWMDWEPIPFEKIMQRFPFTSSQLHHLLLSLQVKKCIERLPGPAYLRME